MPESVRKTVSLPLGLVRCGIYGALMNESVKRLDPLAGCYCWLAEQSERLRIEVGIGAVPRDGAVRLRGIEAAEVSSAATTAAAAASAEAAATTTAKPAASTAKTTAAEGSAESSAAAVSAKQAALAGSRRLPDRPARRDRLVPCPH